MSIPSRSTRRVILLGVFVLLSFVGISLPRPISKAQEPARVPQLKALREQIIALHIEIDLLEIEQEIDRHQLSEAIKKERVALAEYKSCLQGDGQAIHLGAMRVLSSKGMDIWSLLSASEQVDEVSFKKLLSKREKEVESVVIEKFGKDFANEIDALARIESKGEFSKVRQRLADQAAELIMKKVSESVGQESAPLKKEFARRSAELAGNKLDLDDLERRYREAR